MTITDNLELIRKNMGHILSLVGKGNEDPNVKDLMLQISGIYNGILLKKKDIGAERRVLYHKLLRALRIVRSLPNNKVKGKKKITEILSDTKIVFNKLLQ